MIILLLATVALVSADLQSVVSFQATGSGTFFVVCDGLSREIASVAELAVSRVLLCLILSGLFVSLSFVSLSLCFSLLCLSPPRVALSQFPSLFSLVSISVSLFPLQSGLILFLLQSGSVCEGSSTSSSTTIAPGNGPTNPALKPGYYTNVNPSDCTQFIQVFENCDFLRSFFVFYESKALRNSGALATPEATLLNLIAVAICPEIIPTPVWAETTAPMLFSLLVIGCFRRLRLRTRLELTLISIITPGPLRLVLRPRPIQPCSARPTRFSEECKIIQCDAIRNS